MAHRVTVVGAGLAGLCCARELAHAGAGAGVEVVVLEASDRAGGRVATDVFEGFLLDRGFQVLLTAYPESRRVLDYPALELKTFFPGAMVRFEGRFHRLADPFRAPGSAIPTILSPIGSLADKFRIARLRMSLAQYSLDQLFARHEVTTRERLAGAGFSAAMIDRFFRPFFGGIFLEAELRTSSRAFDFVFRMLAEGDIAVPARGMAAIPEQLARSLPPGTIRLDSAVNRLEDLDSSVIVIATDGSEAVRLLGGSQPAAARGVWCYYFAMGHPPTPEPILFLNGDGFGPINNCCVISNVAPCYAPPGHALLSATVLESVSVHSESIVRAQLADWFGPSAAQWTFLRRYFIAQAQPEQAPPALEPPRRPVRVGPHLFVCGDHRDNASINGAMSSGRRTAEVILRDLRLVT